MNEVETRYEEEKNQTKEQKRKVTGWNSYIWVKLKNQPKDSRNSERNSRYKTGDLDSWRTQQEN